MNEAVAQIVQLLPSMHEVLGLIPALYEWGAGAHVCHLGILEVEAGGLEFQGYPWLPCEFNNKGSSIKATEMRTHRG